MSAEQIARGLTKAQRAAVILWDGGDDKDLSDMMKGLARDGGIIGLVDAGICYRPTNAPPRATSLTPLGLAVRDYLKEQDDG